MSPLTVIFHYFDQTVNQLIKKIIRKLIDNRRKKFRPYKRGNWNWKLVKSWLVGCLFQDVCTSASVEQAVAASPYFYTCFDNFV